MYPIFYGLKLAKGGTIENLVTETLTVDPALLEDPGRIWFNSTSKLLKVSILDGADQVVADSLVLSAQFTPVQTAVASLQSNVTLLQTRVTTLEGTVTDLESEMTLLDDGLSDVGQAVSNLSLQVTANTNTLGVLTPEVQAHALAISGLQSSVGSLNTTVTALSGTVAGHTSTLSSLSTTVAGHTTQLDTLSTTVSGHTTSINNLSSTVSGHTSAISSLTSSVSDNTSAISSLSGTVTSQGSAIGTLQTSMTAVQNRTTTLETNTGNLTLLTTAAKSSLVAAINEVFQGPASRLTTARSIGITGDATWSVSFLGDQNVSAALTLANTSVVAGTYGSGTKVPRIQVDSKGRITDVTLVDITGGGGGGAALFVDLDDVPGSYAGAAGYSVRVNALATGLEFVEDAPSGGGTVTSVNINPGSSGLTFGGGPITTSGEFSVGGRLNIAFGGTGATTAAGARSNLGAAQSGANTDLVSITGMTGDVGLVRNLKMRRDVSTPSADPASLTWDDTYRAFQYRTDTDGVLLHVGMDDTVLVRNTSGDGIGPNAIVWVTGATGNILEVAPARAERANAELLEGVLGFAIGFIASGALGRVMCRGDMTGFRDMTGFAPGTPVYLSPTDPGDVYAYPPTDDSDEYLNIRVGYVSSAADPGSVHVDIRTPDRLRDLLDVYTDSANTNDVLSYQGGGLWVPMPVASLVNLTMQDIYNNSPDLTIQTTVDNPTVRFQALDSLGVGVPVLAIMNSAGTETVQVFPDGRIRGVDGEFTDDLSVAGDATVGGNLTVTGDFRVNGTTTFVNTQVLQVKDNNIELNYSGSPSDFDANGGGITLLGTTNKLFRWLSASNAWTSNVSIDLATGNSYRINNISILSSTTLGSSVVNSSLTSVGTVTTGRWEASIGPVSGAEILNLTAANLNGLVPAANLPIASAGTRGAIRVGSGLSIDGAGVLSASGGGGSSTFLGLTDTPSSYTNKRNSATRVSGAENSLEFYDPFDPIEPVAWISPRRVTSDFVDTTVWPFFAVPGGQTPAPGDSVLLTNSDIRNGVWILGSFANPAAVPITRRSDFGIGTRLRLGAKIRVGMLPDQVPRLNFAIPSTASVGVGTDTLSDVSTFGSVDQFRIGFVEYDTSGQAAIGGLVNHRTYFATWDPIALTLTLQDPEDDFNPVTFTSTGTVTDPHFFLVVGAANPQPWNYAGTATLSYITDTANIFPGTYPANSADDIVTPEGPARADGVVGSQQFFWIWNKESKGAAQSPNRDGQTLQPISIGAGSYAGDSCTAIGPISYADQFSLAFGYETTALTYAMAFGSNAFAEDHSTAMGSNSIARAGGIALGEFSRSEAGGVALGTSAESQALGSSAFAFQRTTRPFEFAQGLLPLPGTASPSRRILHLRGEGTPTAELLVHSSALIPDSYRIWRFSGLMSAVRPSTGARSTWDVSGMIVKRGTAVGTTEIALEKLRTSHQGAGLDWDFGMTVVEVDGKDSIQVIGASPDGDGEDPSVFGVFWSLTLDIQESSLADSVVETTWPTATYTLPPIGGGGSGSGSRILDSVSRILTAEDANVLLAPTTALTYTIPAGLTPMPSFSVDCPASGAVTIAVSGGATLNGGTSSITRTRASNPVGFVVVAHNEADSYGISGA